MGQPGGQRGSHAVREMVAELDFRRLLRVRLAGQCGDGLFQGALFGAAFFNPEKATSAGAAAAAFAALLLPYSVVGPFAGVLLDRWARQRILLVSNALRAGLLVLVAVSLARSGATSPATVGVSLLAVSLNRFVLSGLSAALPQVVVERRLVTANAFTTTLGAGATTVGGFTSVALREVWGKDDDGAALTALAACLVYALTALLAARLDRRRLGPTDQVDRQPLSHALVTVGRGLWEGARHVGERPPAARALLAITAHRFFSGVAFVATLLLYTAHGYLHRGFYGLGQVLSATVVGGLVAALVTPRVTRRVGTQRWIVMVLTAAAAVEVVLGTPYTHPAFVVCALGLGFAAQAAKICVDTLVQESVEDAYRGRVFSLYDTLFNVSFVASAGLSAVLVPDNGKSYLVVGLIAGGYLLTAAVYGVLVRLRSAGEPPEPVLAARLL